MGKKTKRVRLYDHEANELNIDLRKHDIDRSTARYTLNEDDLSILTKLRSNHVRNTPMSIKATSTLEDGQGNIKLQWIKRDKTEEDRLSSLRTAIDTLKEAITPAKPVAALNNSYNDKLCNQYTLTDYHLGMMAWGEETGDDWDLKIAEDVLVRFFEVAMAESPNAKECIFAQIGDFLHWDGLDAVTPASKHVLDADTRFTKLVRVTIRVIKRVVKMLLEKYEKVTLIMAEGNHDPASSVWLREVFYSFYEDEPRLVVDTNPDPYYCVVFGKVCLFYHHGHKKNIKTIESSFIGKFKKEFGNSEFVYGHTGHLHHDRIESNLMILEQHRTLSAKDAYSSRGGYLSGRDSKLITYHKDYGEVNRSIISINRLR